MIEFMVELELEIVEACKKKEINYSRKNSLLVVGAGGVSLLGGKKTTTAGLGVGSKSQKYISLLSIQLTRRTYKAKENNCCRPKSK